MNVMISFTLVVVISVAGLALIFLIGTPLLEKFQNNFAASDSEKFLINLDSSIKQVSGEAAGSSRIVRSSDGLFSVNSKSDTIQFSTTSNVLDYFARKISGNLEKITGSDVTCEIKDGNGDGSQDIVLENSFFTAALKYTPTTSNINTSQNILLIKEKNTNKTVAPQDSSVLIDNLIDSSYGTGSSELLQTGKELVSCSARFSVNSTSGFKYGIFYTLYSGSDFVVVEVRNIRK